ncbi:MAG: hypothetical protein ACRCRW_16575 [Aeromonadaceae bacterium]
MPPRLARLLLLLLCTLMLWRGIGPFVIPDYLPNMDKWVHAAVFALLFAIFEQAFPGKLWRQVCWVLAFGLLIELLQIGTRHTPSLFDWLADLAGVTAYLLLRHGYLRWEQHR